MNMTGKGTFIVLDGNDGSGKATQAALLSDALTREGHTVVKVDFPAYDRNVFGALLAECLAGKRGDFLGLDPRIASTLYAADRFEASTEIRTALASGAYVIADRFTSSNQIHQGGKIEDKDEREAFLLWLDRMEHEVFGIPRPDRIIYLRVPVDTSLMLLKEKRAAKNTHLADGEVDQVEQDRRYLERSHEAAQLLAQRFNTWRVIDCADTEGIMRTREAIHEDVCKALVS